MEGDGVVSRLYTEADTFHDESGSVWVGKVFTVPGFEKWLAAQKLTRELLYVVDHHTYVPPPPLAPSSPTDLANRVKAIGANYYWKPKSKGGRGWTWGYMPHLWESEIDGIVYVFVGTHPSWAAPQCTHFNKRGLGIETWWNGYHRAWTRGIHWGLWRIHVAIREWAGVPLTRAVTGPVNTNMPSGRPGRLFHRDAKDSNKDCPGPLNTHARLYADWQLFEQLEEEDMSYTDDDRLRDAYTSVRVLGLTFDVKILEARQREDAAQVDYLERLKARDVRNERIRHNIQKGEIDTTPIAPPDPQ